MSKNYLFVLDNDRIKGVRGAISMGHALCELSVLVHKGFKEDLLRKCFLNFDEDNDADVKDMIEIFEDFTDTNILYVFTYEDKIYDCDEERKKEDKKQRIINSF